MAVLLVGLHYQPQHHSNQYGYVDVDFRRYVDNIKQHVQDPFTEYTIDFFICTNHSSFEKELNVYNPVKTSFIDDPGHTYRLKKYKGLCDILDSNVNYDIICMTRFDIYFMEPFQVDISKLNIFSILEHNDVICDNFYLFPGKMLRSMIEIFNKREHASNADHFLKNVFEASFEVNYIKNERVFVRDLTSYKLHL